MQSDSLEDSREKLLHILSDYQGFNNVKIIIVFDAYKVQNGKRKKEKYDNLTVIYTKEGETADVYIERFVKMNSIEYIVRVVTSDYLEQTIVLGSGGYRVTPMEFLNEIKNSGKDEKENIKKTSKGSNDIGSNLNKETVSILEKFRRMK